MIKLGITGFPLAHTRSPALHRKFLRDAGLKGCYDVLPFDPSQGKRAFFRFLDLKRAEGYRGLNVTIPFKEWAYQYAKLRGGFVKGLDGTCARRFGAANTLLFSDSGKVLAANTDSTGLWGDIEQWICRFGKPEARIDLLIIGTGGSARGALAGVLAGHPGSWRVRSIAIWGRNAARTSALLKLVPRKFRAAPNSPRSDGILLVLWCLPALSRRESRAIFAEATESNNRSLGDIVALYDLNYGDRATGAAGLVPANRSRTGLAMLRGQALASFGHWLGTK